MTLKEKIKEKNTNLENFRKRNKNKQFKYNNLIKTISIILSTAILSSYITYTCHQKIIELHNNKQFYTPVNAIETPYNIYVKQESIDNLVYAYLVNTATGEQLKIYKNMAIGDITYRIDSIIGNKYDEQSVKGKIEKTKNSFIDKLNELYQKAKDSIKRNKNN